MNGLNCHLKGVIAGMGKQKQSAYVVFVGNWIVTIPLATMWVFAYEKGIMYVWGMKVQQNSF